MNFDHRAPPPSGPAHWEKEFALKLFADMVRIRRMEEKLAECCGAGKIRAFLHLYICEEATLVGALHALNAQDKVVATYRVHSHPRSRDTSSQRRRARLRRVPAGEARGQSGSA